MDKFNTFHTPSGTPEQSSSSCFPLSLTSRADRVRIIDFLSGQRMDERVKDMGLAPGVEVKVLQNDGSGPLLLLVGETRLALGKGMARKIMVTLVEGQTR